MTQAALCPPGDDSAAAEVHAAFREVAEYSRALSFESGEGSIAPLVASAPPFAARWPAQKFLAAVTVGLRLLRASGDAARARDLTRVLRTWSGRDGEAAFDWVEARAATACAWVTLSPPRRPGNFWEEPSPPASPPSSPAAMAEERAPGTFDAEKRRAFASRCPAPVTREALRGRSPVAIPDDPKAEWRTFVSALFPSGGALLLTRAGGQGDFLTLPGGGLLRLAEDRESPPVPCGWDAAEDARFFLTNAVSGRWSVATAPDGNGGLKTRWSRRAFGCVAGWSYLCAESDEDAETWLRCLTRLPVAVAAVFDCRDGSRLGALLRHDAGSRAGMSAALAALGPVLRGIGSPPETVSILTALPLPRDGRRVWWLDPAAEPQSLSDKFQFQ